MLFFCMWFSHFSTQIFPIIWWWPLPLFPWAHKYHHSSITKVWNFTELVVWAFCVSLTELGGLPHIFSIEFSVLLLCCELWNWGQICRGCKGARPNSKRNSSTPFLKRSLRFQIQRWSNLKGMAESRSSGAVDLDLLKWHGWVWKLPGLDRRSGRTSKTKNVAWW